jgi:hypothetical protein
MLPSSRMGHRLRANGPGGDLKALRESWAGSPKLICNFAYAFDTIPNLNMCLFMRKQRMSTDVPEDPSFETTLHGRRGRPKTLFRKSNLIGVRCSPRMVTALDEFILDQNDFVGRPEAIRRIVCGWLVEKGHLLSPRQRMIQTQSTSYASEVDTSE